MKEIIIKSPIWKTKSVGLAEYKLTDDVIVVKIDYRTDDGEKLFPGVYKMSRQKIMTYPTQVVHGIRLRIIPIKDFDHYIPPDR